MRKKAVISLFILFAYSFGLAAPPGVVIYNGPDFTGDSLLLEHAQADLAATDFSDLSIGSIHVPTGCRVTLYSETRFAGQTLTLLEDQPDLSKTALRDGAIASIDIQCEQVPMPRIPGASSISVILFSEPSYRGDYEIFEGEQINLADSLVGNDRVASIMIPNHFEIRLFEHSHFRGESSLIDESIPDLNLIGFGRNRLSSFTMHPLDRLAQAPHDPCCNDGLDWWGAEPVIDLALEVDSLEEAAIITAGALLINGIIHSAKKRNMEHAHRGQVEIFDEPGYQGRSQGLKKNIRRMKKSPLGNDAICSISVPQGYEVVLYEHEGYRGASTVLRRSVADLDHTPLGNRTVSSLRVRWIGP